MLIGDGELAGRAGLRHVARNHVGVRKAWAILAAILLLAFSCLAWPASVTSIPIAQGNRVAHFGVLAFRPKPETLARWQPLIDYLNQAGLKQKFVLDAYTYPELEQAIREQRVDVVLTQPAHYILMSSEEGLYSPLATLVESDNGLALSEFGGVIVKLASRTDIRSLSDIQGKRIATSSTESLGGYLVQAYELKKLGIDVAKDDTLIQTGMPHDRAVQAVLSGAADVGFVRTGLLEGMARDGKVDLSRLAVLKAKDVPNYPLTLSTPLYPEWALAAMPWLDPVLGRQVAAAVLSLPHGGAVARAARIDGFTIPGNYKVVEDMMRSLGVPPFERHPNTTLYDFWKLHRGGISVFSLMLSAVFIVMLMAVLRAHSRLHADHQKLERARDLIFASEERLRSYVESAPEGIFVMDDQGRLVDLNPAASALIGYAEDELLGKGISDLVSDADAARIRQAGGGPVELTLRSKEGREVYVSMKTVRLPGDGVMVFASDITERRYYEEALTRQAHYDFLTQVCNRGYFMELAEQELARAKRYGSSLSMLMLDLDEFKSINDRFGHKVGDAVLKHFAEICRQFLREVDVIGRMGGEEFAILLPETSRDKAVEAAERLRGSVADCELPFEFDVMLRCTVSIGVSSVHSKQEDVDALLTRADKALYEAKNGGRNRVCTG